MSALKTPREYLASLTPPLAKMGRGRFSAAAKAELARAAKAGMKFADPTPAKPAKSAAPSLSKNVRSKKVEKPVAAAEAPVVEKPKIIDLRDVPTPEMRPDRLYGVWTSADGIIKKSFKDCCVNPVQKDEGIRSCGFSIAWCPCPVPGAFDRDGKTVVPLSPVEKSRNVFGPNLASIGRKG